MRKGYLYLLTVTMVIASIIIAGCATSDQANIGSSSETSTNASTTTTNTTTASSSVASASPTVTPLPSASPTATPTPSVTAKIATSIQLVYPGASTGQTIGVNVISSASGIRICAPGLVTASKGTITSGGSDCFYTAYLDTSSFNSGDSVTLKFVGDSAYQPSQTVVKIP